MESKQFGTDNINTELYNLNTVFLNALNKVFPLKLIKYINKSLLNTIKYSKLIKIRDKLLFKTQKTFKKHIFERIDKTKELNLLWEKLNQKLTHTAIKSIPASQMFEKEEAIKALSVINDLDNRICHEMRKLYKSHKTKEIKKKIKKIKEVIEKNPDKIFQTINNSKGRNKIKHYLDKNTVISEPKAVNNKVKEIWENTWRTRNTKENELEKFLENQPKAKSHYSISPIICKAIKHIIKNHKSNSAPGNNDISWKM